MKYFCKIRDFNYVFESSEDEEDRIDFLLAAETACEEFDKSKNEEMYDSDSIDVEVKSYSGTKKNFNVVKTLKPNYRAKDLEENDI